MLLAIEFRGIAIDEPSNSASGVEEGHKDLTALCLRLLLELACGFQLLWLIASVNVPRLAIDQEHTV